MAVPDEFSIPLSRTRLGAIILFGLVIISIGIWMAVGTDPAIADRGLPELMQAFGVFGIVGFGLITVYASGSSSIHDRV